MHLFLTEFLATNAEFSSELYDYINYWLNYDNLLLEIITQLTVVKFNENGEQFLGIAEKIVLINLNWWVPLSSIEVGKINIILLKLSTNP